MMYDNENPMSMSHFLRHVQQGVGALKEPEFEHLSFLTDEEVATANKMKAMADQIGNLYSELETIRQGFWAGVKTRTGEHRSSLKLDEVTQSILKKKEDA